MAREKFLISLVLFFAFLIPMTGVYYMGEATGNNIQSTINDDLPKSNSDTEKIFIIGSSRMMGLDALYIEEILETEGKQTDVFNRGLSSDLPSRRLTVLDQNISEKPDIVLIGIDYANYLEKTDISSNLSTQTIFKGCETKLPEIQDAYSFFSLESNLKILDSTNFDNPKLSTLKLFSESFLQETNFDKEKKSKEIEILFAKSMNSYSKKNLEEAIAYNNKILEINPNYYDAILNNGFFLLRLNKVDEASYFVNKAVNMHPNSILANANKQLLLEKQGKITESQIFSDKVKELEKQKVAQNKIPDDFEFSQDFSGKQSWNFNDPSWRIAKSDQWLSVNIDKRGTLNQFSLPFEPRGFEAKSLIKIIQNIQENNIRIILFTTPVYKDLYYSVDSCQFKNYESWLQKLSSDYNIPVFFLHDKYLELDIWRDQTHIIWGKTIYTEDVANIISKEI